MEDSAPGKLGDERLVALAQNGELAAFETLVERYKHKAYRIAFDFARDREEAKDLSQEAFLRAFSNIRRFDRRSSFYTWFYRILVNLCHDYRRRSSRVSWEPLDEQSQRGVGNSDVGSAPASPDRAARTEELSSKVGKAVEALPPNQRAAFILRNHQGLSIQEIARIMQTAEGTVKSHLHRAVVTLRQKLAGVI